LSEYYRAPANRDDLLRLCKACCAILRRRRYVKSRQSVLEQQRDYCAAHREEILAARRAHRKEYPEYDRAYNQRNKKRLLEYARRYREAKKAPLS
jgi:hypothetical protein